MAMQSERNDLKPLKDGLERSETMAVDEPGRRPWQPPKVILSEIDRTNGGINADTDVDFSQTS